MGDPNGRGGTDYRLFPRAPYFLDLDDISRPGTSPLLEVPVTIDTDCPRVLQADAFPLRKFGIVERIVTRIWRARWLRPNGCNLAAMLAQISTAASSGASYVEFMLHSSELMPGGSPTFASEDSIERLYEHLDALFERASRSFRGATLAEFRAEFCAAA
jgi:hypothetical protein